MEYRERASSTRNCGKIERCLRKRVHVLHEAGCILVKRFDPNAYKFPEKSPRCPIRKVQRLGPFSAMVRSQVLTSVVREILGSIHVRTNATVYCEPTFPHGRPRLCTPRTISTRRDRQVCIESAEYMAFTWFVELTRCKYLIGHAPGEARVTGGPIERFQLVCVML